MELSPKTDHNVGIQRYDLRFRLGGVASGFHFSWQGAVFGEPLVRFFVAGAVFGEPVVRFFVASAVFSEPLVQFFVAGAVFGAS